MCDENKRSATQGRTKIDRLTPKLKTAEKNGRNFGQERGMCH